MTDFNKIKFSVTDYFKGLFFVVSLIVVWYDLKTDFKVFKATTELRINALERQNGQQEANIVYKNKEAVMPNEIKLKTE